MRPVIFHVWLDPDNANGYAHRGNAFNNARKYDRAIEDYNEALRLNPDFAQAFSDRGAAWYFRGEYQKAIADYKIGGEQLFFPNAGSGS